MVWSSAKNVSVDDPQQNPAAGAILKVSGGSHLRALVEWHKRVALPVSCLVLVCVGAPMGGLNRRTGRLSGFAISAGGLLLDYIVVTAGSSLAELSMRREKLLGVSGANALVVTAAVYLVLDSQ